MRLKTFLFVAVVFYSSTAFGQVGGKATYQFLNIVSSPIQDALGGKLVTSLGDDVNQGIINPSVINPKMENRLGLNYGNYFSDINFGTAAYGYSWGEKKKTILAGVTYINYGDFEGADEFGNRTSDFTASEVALSVGYAYSFPEKNTTVGANVKLVTSSFESYSSFGGLLDLSVLHKKKDKDLVYTLVLRNIGTQFSTYSGVSEPMPFEIVAGISNKLAHAPVRWHITFKDLQTWKTSYSQTAISSEQTTFEDTSVYQDLLHHLNLGVELFPDKIITVRVGYNFRRNYELFNKENKNFSGLATGFGIRFKKLRFDYSFSRYSVAANTSLFGLQFTF